MGFFDSEILGRVLTMMVPGQFEIPRFFRWVFDDLDFRASFDCVIFIPWNNNEIRD